MLNIFCFQKGHTFEFDNRLLTVFSAPYYSGHNSNLGSVATISKSLKLRIVTLKPNKGYDRSKLDKRTLHDFEKNFQPLDENPRKNSEFSYYLLQKSIKTTYLSDCFNIQFFTVSCQFNVPPNGQKMSPFLGEYSMFAHETQFCKKDNETPVKKPYR